MQAGYHILGGLAFILIQLKGNQFVELSALSPRSIVSALRLHLVCSAFGESLARPAVEALGEKATETQADSGKLDDLDQIFADQGEDRQARRGVCKYGHLSAGAL